MLAAAANAAPRISEFMAINDITLRSDLGSTSDWIEIENPDATEVSLNGWYLTDNQEIPTKWQFPDVSIPPNGFLLVYASNENRTDPSQALHTNFNLQSAGEYLALVQPDGKTIASSFTPPQQFKDLSFGVGAIGAILTSKPIEKGTQAKYLVPTEDPGVDWRVPSYDDGVWASGALAFGFDNSGPYLDLLGEGGNIADATKGVNASVYVRAAFELPDPGAVIRMVLNLNWEDGVVGYLNGEQILAMNAPDPLEWDSDATSSHSDGEAVVADIYELDFVGKLVQGTNVLAFQVMNTSKGGSDLLLLPELSLELKDTSQGEAEGFFEEPTPGTPNSAGKLPPAYVEVTPATKAYTEDSIPVTITTGNPEAVIRYTTDGTAPTADIADPSPIYEGPITVDATTQIRARAFLPGALDGPIQTQGYFKLEEDAMAFTSDLPIVLVESFENDNVGSQRNNKTVPLAGATNRLPTIIAIFEPKPVQGQEKPRASMLNPPDFVTRAGIRKRGSSSGGWAKYHMSVEAWTETNWEEKTIAPLGFAPADDWILGSFFTFDKALIRNPFIFEMSNQVGRYAARTKHVEVWHNIRGDIGGRDYFGVYTWGERLDRGRSRIDVDSLNETIDSEPDISGGYIFKRDRGSPSFSARDFSSGSWVHVYPDGANDRNRPDDFKLTKAQKDWLIAHMNEIGGATRAEDGINPDTGKHMYEYVDMGSVVDHVILNTLAMNVDWGRLSAWLHLPRNGKLQAGPIWDFDRNMGSEDGRDDRPDRLWDGPPDSSKTWWDSRYPYFGDILGFTNRTSNGPPRHQSSRPDVLQLYIDRWSDLRKGVLSTENMHSDIDGMADNIREAQDRNWERWGGERPSQATYSGGDRTWEGSIVHMKEWMKRRAEWMDDQFPDEPVFNVAGGSVAPGFEMALTFRKGTAYYTTDGSDPRSPGGTISPSAALFEGGAINSTILATDAPVNYVIPSDDSLGTNWINADFDDSGWTEAATGVGWETAGGTLEPEIKTNISDQLRGNNAGAYFRWNFEFSNADNINGATLKIQSDDGFVAYINGVKVAELNAPNPIAWDSEATRSNRDSDAVEGEEIDITKHKSALRNGTNVLAIHAMNTSVTGSDFLIKAGLDVNETVVPNPIALNNSQMVTARTFDGTFWSAPAKASFAIGATPASSQNIVVSELMYHPPQPSSAERGTDLSNSDFFEYAELLNISSETVDLTGVSFAGAITFTLAPGTFVGPGQRVLVANKRRALVERYGEAVNRYIVGEYSSSGTQFANGGEEVNLVGANQASIQKFTYGDSAPWPEEADGNGFSLVLVSPESSPNHNVAVSWTTGAEFGTPGTGEEIVGGTTFSGDPNADNDGDGLSAFAEYALGTLDTDGASGPGAVEVAEDSGNLLLSFPKNTAASDVIFSVERSTDLKNWTSQGVKLVSETPINDGLATAVFQSEVPDATEVYMRVRLTQK